MDTLSAPESLERRQLLAARVLVSPPGRVCPDNVSAAVYGPTAPKAPATPTSSSSLTDSVAAFVVSTLADNGPGSLRQAMLNANAAISPATIRFDVTGTIVVGTTPLPTITNPVTLVGPITPGGSAAPAITVDFEKTTGFVVAAGADGTAIGSLAIVDASSAGIRVIASNVTVAGCFIGVEADGVTVQGNQGDGIHIEASSRNNLIGSVASTDTFTVSNVISGNGGNGITVAGGEGSTIAMNNIGTDVTGTVARPNAASGIQLTAGATNTLIGGVAYGADLPSGGNNPTGGVFVRPAQGNLISGNTHNGVLIDDGATLNQLSGNYIGTTASGSASLGNGADGVAIVAADGNRLLGTTATQSPFVFYNVLSGNRGNGLRITDSNDTVVHANFCGLGADNATAVPNLGSGMLVSGRSARVNAGGEIPLGNVMSGNAQHGIEVRDTASGLLSFNNFVGQSAFGGAVPNQAAGILISSTNPAFDLDDSSTWNRVRTCLIGGNGGDGIVFAGGARGAEVTDTAVGTNSNIKLPIPNGGNGIVVGGSAHTIAIGGFEPSVERVDGGFGVHVGSNGGYGIVIQDQAHNIQVFNTRIGIGVGLTMAAAAPLPNARGGMLIEGGASAITLGGDPNPPDPKRAYANQIVGNQGTGLSVTSATGVRVLGNSIQGNAGYGISLAAAAGNTIGTPDAPNQLRGNGLSGLFATGALDGTRIDGNTISANGQFGIYLSAATGLAVGGNGRGNTVTANTAWNYYAAGIYVDGNSAGTTVSANTISANGGSGLMLSSARGLRIGGTAPGEGNVVISNRAFGLYAVGDCAGSVVLGNSFAFNGLGNEQLARATGLVVAG